MIVGQVATSWIGYYLNSYYTARFLDYSLKDQIVDVLPTLSIASVMGAGVYSIRWLGLAEPVLTLGLQLVAGVVIYLLLCRVLRLAAFMEMMRMVESKWKIFRKADPVLS